MTEPRFLLDTNIVSHLVKGTNARVDARARNVPLSRLCISAITEAELRYGLARKPAATRLHTLIQRFLDNIDILPWDSHAARAYGHLACVCEREGLTLGAFDRLIGAHSIAADRVLVSNDRAFARLTHHLRLEDWTLPE